MVLLLIIDKTDYPRFVRGRILTTVSLAHSEPEFRTLVSVPAGYTNTAFPPCSGVIGRRSGIGSRFTWGSLQIRYPAIESDQYWVQS
jgi:hypothetical protein